MFKVSSGSLSQPNIINEKKDEISSESDTDISKFAFDILVKQSELDTIIDKEESYLEEFFIVSLPTEFIFNLNHDDQVNSKTNKIQWRLIDSLFHKNPELKNQVHIDDLIVPNSNLEIRTLMDTIQQTAPTQDEESVLHDILQVADHNMITEILKGAHVRLYDNGMFYEKWSTLESARERISSHPAFPKSKQYGIMGPLTKEILFGIVEVDNTISTFFQLENTPWAPGFKNRVLHTHDAVKYLASGKNIGPYGKSKHTDKNPIRIEVGPENYV